MPSSPIITKVTVPPRAPGILHRERLTDFIHEHIDHKVILVSAPAGYGKTTLLVDFAHQTDLPVCWYRLDPIDRDPHVFLEHLLASIQRRFPEFGKQSERLLEVGPSIASSASDIVGTLVNEMIACIPEWFAVILDDFHCVEDSPEIVGLFETLVNYQPEHCHVVIASRTLPASLSLASLTTRKELVCLEQDDLRFTTQEIQALLSGEHRIEMPPAEAQRLATESEGWIAGILLTSQHLLPGMLDTWARARASGKPLYEYLAGEVMERQAVELQDFLLTSSTLEEMTPSACSEVLGLQNADNYLRELSRRNLFTTQLDTGTSSFRYHALFRDFLQARLKATVPDRFRTLHRRVANWSEMTRNPELAARHYLVAGDESDAARVMNGIARRLLRASHLRTLISWAESLSESELSANPHLAFCAAEAAYGSGLGKQALTWLHLAEESFRVRDDRDNLAGVLSTRARILHNEGKYSDSMELARRGISLLTPDGLSTGKAAVDAYRILGMCLMRQGRFDEAEKCFRTASTEAEREGDASSEVLANQGLAVCLEWLGKVSEAARLQSAVVRACRKLGSPRLLAEALNDMAYHLYLSGDYTAALNTLQESLEIAHQIEHQQIEAFALVTLGEVLRDIGDDRASAESLEKGLDVSKKLGIAFLSAYGREALAVMHLRQGEFTVALEYALEALELAEQQGARAQAGRHRASLGLVQVETGEIDEGVLNLVEAIKLLEETAAKVETARAQLFLAYSFHKMGKVNDALAVFEQTASCYLEAGLEHRLLAECPAALKLVERALSEGIENASLATLLRDAKKSATVETKPLSAYLTGTPLTSSIRVYSFGISRVERNGELIPHAEWPSSTARHLLVYLLLHGPRTREQIAADLWPDINPSRLPGTFHNTKYRLQRTLGISPIVYERGLYSIDKTIDIWHDVGEFNRLVDMTQRLPPFRAAYYLRRAIGLYAGEFLDECYANWSTTVRETLRRRYLEAAAQLTGWLIQRERPREAISVLRQALAIDNLREDFHRQLMRAFAIDGRPDEAMAQYHHCSRILERELGTRPEHRTLSMYLAIRETGSPYDNE